MASWRAMTYAQAGRGAGASGLPYPTDCRKHYAMVGLMDATMGCATSAPKLTRLLNA